MISAGRSGNDEKLAGIPVILLSYLSEAGDILKGLESGAGNFVVKPYIADSLVSYIRDELSEARPGGQEDQLLPPFELEFAGKPYMISSSVRQILQTLLATYETAVRKNEELIRAETDLRLLNEFLEEKVRERTAALTAEIAERRRWPMSFEKKSKRSRLTRRGWSKATRSCRILSSLLLTISRSRFEKYRRLRTWLPAGAATRSIPREKITSGGCKSRRSECAA